MWDVAQRLHWDSQWAKAIGNPLAYDYGVLRQSWFYHHVADWAGDDAFIEKMSDSIRKFNYHGRHAVPVGRRWSTSGRRTAGTWSTSSSR